ncbi:putative alpha-1,6-mannosyltransferase mnn11 [Coniosporium apollinis]|uniref:Alpha-1,6-mannosyltransferase mnn11 n=1 Tax=Coniosporium apollinis TaxID=61459 RepID=A0ABQ9NV09_9PEZI|nr:putative alpha-1,6-mannosyltransferase mnn11 [Coniosporium apollinis]
MLRSTPQNYHLSPVSAAISDHLVTITKLLVQIAYPDDYLNSNPQSLIRTLPVTAVSLRGAVSSKTSTLALKRTALADLASAVLATHRQLLETGIRILEQTMHGAVARGVRARAEHLAVVAKGMELKLRIIMQTQAPDEGLLSALEVYTSHLAATTKALLAREKAAKGTLQRYEAAGPGMEDIATRYARVCKEIGAVKGEIERLEGKT